MVTIRGLGTEEASLHKPPSGTRLDADSVGLEEAEWRHQLAFEGQNQQSRKPRIGTEEGSLRRPTLQPIYVPPSG